MLAQVDFNQGGSQMQLEALYAFLAAYSIFVLVIVGFFVFVNWKLFEKAGKPGWAAIVPIYNIIVYLEIVKMPIWWLILMLIPCVNFVAFSAIGIIGSLRLAKAFGKDTGFAIGLILLPIVFLPLLVFSNAEYQPDNLDPNVTI